MRTRTSMGSLFLRIFRGSRTAAREKLCKSTCYGGRHELVDLPAEGRDLLDPARGDEADRRARHDVDRLDLRRKRAVQLVHLELPLEVRDHAQPLDDRLRVPLAREINDELGEDVDLDVLQLGESIAEKRDALVEREHRLLVVWTAHDADDDAVEDARGAGDHVDMAVRDGIVRARTNRSIHSSRPSSATPEERESCSNTVTRVEPYLRVVRTAKPGNAGSDFAAVSNTSNPLSASTRGT